MKPHLRIVTQIPVPELWDASGVLDYKRGRALGRSDVAALLRIPGLRVVVADVGHRLSWFVGNELFKFWKSDARARIVSPEAGDSGFCLEDFPGEYAYIATQWDGPEDSHLVLLERYH